MKTHLVLLYFRLALGLATAVSVHFAQAMERYDYIVFTKAYPHADFINRTESPYKISSAGQVNAFMANNITLSSVIVTIALLSSGAVLGLLLCRNAKRKRQ